MKFTKQEMSLFSIVLFTFFSVTVLREKCRFLCFTFSKSFSVGSFSLVLLMFSFRLFSFSMKNVLKISAISFSSVMMSSPSLSVHVAYFDDVK